MSASVFKGNYLMIGERTKLSDSFSSIGYCDITEEIKQTIAANPHFHTIQIDHSLPTEAYPVIDELLALRPNITFRIFGLRKQQHFNLDVLVSLQNLTRLRLDCIDLSTNPKLMEVEKLCKLTGLKSLTLELFDLHDYRFVQDLDKGIEELSITADTMKGAPVFDCQWLLSFPKIHTLYLGKKAKKNYKCVAKLPNLKNLALRGIPIDNFDFLKETQLEVLRILWASIKNFDSLSALKSLKHLELWRIPKLDDISAIQELKNLESLKLQDLRHITELPDISDLTKFKELILINTPIPYKSIPEHINIKSWA